MINTYLEDMRENFFQTKVRGSNNSEYQLYLDLADNGKGIDITTGNPMKSFDEWLAS